MSLRLYDVSDWCLGIRVSPWGIPPFDYVQKRFSGFCGFYGFKGGGAAHNAIEAPQSINRAMPESLRIAGFQF